MLMLSEQVHPAVAWLGYIVFSLGFFTQIATILKFLPS